MPKPEALTNVLVLGGSTQARQLVHTIDPAYTVTLSLAGTTRNSSATYPPHVHVRVGGFGGAAGLAAYLKAHQIGALIDATHPYADTMHHHAVRACTATHTPYLRLDRPAWTPPPGATWIEVDGGGAAVETVLAQGWQRVFVTTGKMHLDPWRGLGEQVTVIVRSIDPADVHGIDRVETITQRGPFKVEDEQAILATCDAMVTRNSGGDEAKIRAAVTTNTPIVVLARPTLPPCETVSEVSDALAWLAHTLPIR